MNLNICKNQLKSPSQVILQRLASLSQSQFGSPGSAGKNSACASSVTSGEANLARFVSPGSAMKNSLRPCLVGEGKKFVTL